MLGAVLVIGDSDFHLARYHALLLRTRGVQKIFATNADPLGDYVEPMPLGLTSDCDDSPLHKLYGDSSHLVEAWRRQPDRPSFNGGVYANFKTETAPAWRDELLDWCQTQSFVQVDRPKSTAEGRIAYLTQLRHQNFVICPRGNGVDTHRLWETLYMGGFPIVQRNPGIERAVGNLPVVWVNDWEEIGQSGRLEREWRRLTDPGAKFEWERLSLGFWKERFAAAANRGPAM